MVHVDGSYGWNAADIAAAPNFWTNSTPNSPLNWQVQQNYPPAMSPKHQLQQQQLQQQYASMNHQSSSFHTNVAYHMQPPSGKLFSLDHQNYDNINLNEIFDDGPDDGIVTVEEEASSIAAAFGSNRNLGVVPPPPSTTTTTTTFSSSSANNNNNNNNNASEENPFVHVFDDEFKISHHRSASEPATVYHHSRKRTGSVAFDFMADLASIVEAGIAQQQQQQQQHINSPKPSVSGQKIPVSSPLISENHASSIPAPTTPASLTYSSSPSTQIRKPAICTTLSNSSYSSGGYASSTFEEVSIPDVDSDYTDSPMMMHYKRAPQSRNPGGPLIVRSVSSDSVLDAVNVMSLNSPSSKSTKSSAAAAAVRAMRRSSHFRGVSRCSKDGRWQARIRIGKIVKYLGRFRTEEDAAHCYDEAAREHHGLKAVLNFKKPGDEHYKSVKRTVSSISFFDNAEDDL